MRSTERTKRSTQGATKAERHRVPQSFDDRPAGGVDRIGGGDECGAPAIGHSRRAGGSAAGTVTLRRGRVIATATAWFALIPAGAVSGVLRCRAGAVFGIVHGRSSSSSSLDGWRMREQSGQGRGRRQMVSQCTHARTFGPVAFSDGSSSGIMASPHAQRGSMVFGIRRSLAESGRRRAPSGCCVRPDCSGDARDGACRHPGARDRTWRPSRSVPRIGDS